MPSNSTEYNRMYWKHNKERLKKLAKRRRQKKNAEYKPMPEKYISKSPEAAAIVMLLMRAQRSSGVSMTDFVQGLQKDMTAWKQLRETYHEWRATDEGQRLIGNS